MPLQLAARSCEDATRHSTLEYALSAGFLAVSAGALLPDVADPIKSIWIKMSYLLSPNCIGSPGNSGASNGCGPPTLPPGQ